MEDRFKFRLWNKEENVMKYPDTIFLGCSSNYVLMQCTGLKDKNGKLIYEGDVLIDTNNPQQIDYPMIVKWNNEYGHFRCHWNLRWTSENLKELKIIGNIFEDSHFKDISDM